MDEKRKTNRRRRGLLALLMAGSALISATGATMSLALFTASVSANANGFTTGTIVLGVTPTPTILSSGAMMPGDTVAGQVLVANNGTAQLRYSVTGVATNTDSKGLASQITLTINRADGNAGATCSAYSGDQLFSGTIGYAEAVVIGTNFGANHPYGAGARALNSGVSETLCFRASLPSATGNTYQGATTNMTFTFYAEQTKNN